MTTQAGKDAKVSAAQDAIDALAAFVAATVPPQMITAFTASPISVAPGTPVIISWATKNAIAALLDGVPVGPAGSVTRAPAASTSYNLVVRGSAPDISLSVGVTVQEVPPASNTLATLAPNSARHLGAWPGPGRGAYQRSDYSGLTLDAERNRILFFGGGHGQGQLTDIRVFDLATLQWSSLYPPIAWEDMVAANVLPNGAWSVRGSDPVPCARHTYNSTIVHGGRFYVFMNGGIGVQDINGPLPPAGFYKDNFFCCWYDLTTNKWSWSKYKAPWYFSCACASVGDKVLLVGTDASASNWGYAWLYDPATDDAVRLPNVLTGHLLGGNPTLVHFPPTGKHYALLPDGVVHEISYSAEAPQTSSSRKLPTTGKHATGYLSYAYDPVNKVIGGSIHAGVYTTFDPVTNKWAQSAIDVEAGSTGKPDTVFFASAFDQASGCHILLGPDEQTWAYRPRADGAPIPPPAQPPPVAVSERVRMTDAPTSPGDQDGPNWNYANLILRAPWKNPGGDWRDASDVAQGTNHYAVSPTVTRIGDVSVECKALVARLLTENTGIYLLMLSGGIAFNQPRLRVATDNGTFDAPCIVDTWLNSSSGVLGGSTSLHGPAILKFDLSAMTGAVQSATLTVNVTAGAPCVFAVDFLDSPSLSLSGRPVEQGIAATVARDSDLVNHPKALLYDDLVSHDYIWNNFRSIAGGLAELRQLTEIIDWPQYRLKAARVWATTKNQRLISWHHWGEPKQVGTLARAYQRDYGDGYTHLFVRFLMCIGEDLNDGMTEAGMKLPGLSGTYDWSTSGSVTIPPPNDFQTWSARLWHTALSPSHRGWHRLGTYFYGVEAPIGQYGGSGDPRGAMGLSVDKAHPNALVVPAYLKAGTVHCIEQEIKLNTMAANNVVAWNASPRVLKDVLAEVTANANPDGEMRVWLDGVRVFERTDVRIRGHDKARIQSIPFMNIYHGGMGMPKARFHYDIGGICVATKYIGPPRLV